MLKIELSNDPCERAMQQLGNIEREFQQVHQQVLQLVNALVPLGSTGNDGQWHLLDCLGRKLDGKKMCSQWCCAARHALKNCKR